MTLAPQELENTASKFAAEAIKLDSQGSHSVAIQSYQRASEALIRLVEIYPEYKLNRVYLERASAYQNRIKALQMANGLLGDEAQTSSKEVAIMAHDKGLSDNKHSKSQFKTDSVFKNQNKSSHFANNSSNNNSTLNQFDAKKNPEAHSEFDSLILKE